MTQAPPLRLARRAERIEPFYVMEIFKAAQQLQARLPAGADPLIYLNIGEPDFTAPPLVAEAAARCIRDGRLRIPGNRQRLRPAGNRFRLQGNRG